MSMLQECVQRGVKHRHTERDGQPWELKGMPTKLREQTDIDMEAAYCELQAESQLD